jgi:hypothetical protein
VDEWRGGERMVERGDRCGVKKIKRGSHEWELVWSMRFRDNWCGKIGVVLENFDDWT